MIEQPEDIGFSLDHYTVNSELEVYLLPSKTLSVRSLSVHLSGEGDRIGIRYMGLKGYGNKSKRGIVEAQYESMRSVEEKNPNPLPTISRAV